VGYTVRADAESKEGGNVSRDAEEARQTKLLSETEMANMRDHAREVVAKWEPRPVSEARGDVTFLGRQLEREQILLERVERALDVSAAQVVELREALEAREGLLREWCQYTNLRSRIRQSDDESEYVTGRDLLARTDAVLSAAGTEAEQEPKAEDGAGFARVVKAKATGAIESEGR
jgi:hypothetical protein